MTRVGSIVPDLLKHAGEVRELWRAMCEHDGVDPDAAFVVFSESNPHRAAYDAAMAKYQRWLRTYAAGGRR